MTDSQHSDPETDDPFAEDAFDEEDDSPMGEYGGEVNNEDDAMFDEWDVPQTPIGVLRGHIKSARYVDGTTQEGNPKKSLVLDVQCTALEYQNSETISVWPSLFPETLSLSARTMRTVVRSALMGTKMIAAHPLPVLSTYSLETTRVPGRSKPI